MTNIYNPKELGTTTSYELKDVYITSYDLIGRPSTSRPVTPNWDVRSEHGSV